MKFRCDRVQDGQQCRLSKEHIGKTDCQFQDLHVTSDVRQESKTPKIYTGKRRTKAEVRYENEQLAPRLLAGELKSYEYESIKLKIGVKTWYMPDYYVIESGDGRHQIHEVKSHHRFKEKGIIKLKCAALSHPHYRFFLALYDHGRWDIQEIKA